MKESQQLLTKPFRTVIEKTCPHHVQFVESENNGEFTLSVLPHPSDFGLLIGKGGRQVNAFKYLFKRAGKTLGIDSDFSVVENFATNDSQPKKQFKLDRDELKGLVSEIASMVIGCPVDVEIESGDDRLEVKLFPHHDMTDALHVCAACSSIFFPFGKAHGERVYVLYGKV